MAADEFLKQAWEARVNDLLSDQATLNAHLMKARAEGDLKTAGDAIEGLNDVETRLARLQQQQAFYEQDTSMQPRSNERGPPPA
jgi:hypothetical protein